MKENSQNKQLKNKTTNFTVIKFTLFNLKSVLKDQ